MFIFNPIQVAEKFSSWVLLNVFAICVRHAHGNNHRREMSRIRVLMQISIYVLLVNVVKLLFFEIFFSVA